VVSTQSTTRYNTHVFFFFFFFAIGERQTVALGDAGWVTEIRRVMEHSNVTDFK
jgi:hypothetical protein